MDIITKSERSIKKNEKNYIDDASNGSEIKSRKSCNSRHHSDYVPSNYSSDLTRNKEKYKTVLSIPKESMNTLKNKRDLKSVKL